MLPFQTIVLRKYFQATDWDEDALYSQLVASSARILDFAVPTSVHLAFSKTPTAGFHNSFETTVLTSQMNGSLGYFACSRELNLGGSQHDGSTFRDVVDGFKVCDMPQRPHDGAGEIWLGGERVDRKDYLMYGRCHLPSRRVDGLFLRRHSPTIQSILAFVHLPPQPISPPSSSSSPSHPSSSSSSSSSSQSPSHTQSLPSSPHFKGNALLSLQHSVGRYSTETSFSFSDGLLGIRGLYNFAPSSAAVLGLGGGDGPAGTSSGKKGRVDEEESLVPGVRGRFSVGGEVYLSAKEKSAGMSIAGRFCTLPDPSPSLPNQPSSSVPLTFTLVVNPLMGHTSAAYSSQITPNLALSSRFDLNFYSYQSDWTIGGEWWLRKAAPLPAALPWSPPLFPSPSPSASALDAITGADISPPPPSGPEATAALGGSSAPDTELGVLKMRASTAGDVSLLYTTRISNMLVSGGVVSDLASSSRLGGGKSPVKALGLEIQYFR